MTYRLTSLTLATGFDPPGPRLAAPAVVESGDDPALALFDGAHAGSRVVARIQSPLPLVGIRVDPRGEAVRLALTLVLDDQSADWWQRHHPQDQPLPGDHLRLVTVAAQGVARAACPVVAGGDEPVRQRIVIQLGPEEIGDDGLVVLALGDATLVEGWPPPVHDGATGLMLRRISVEDTSEQLGATLSTGRTKAAPGPHRLPAHPGIVAVNPVGAGGPVELRFRAPGGPTRARVQAVDLAGRSVLDETAYADSEGRLVVRLPGDRGPLLARVLEADAAGLWAVRREFRVVARRS